MHDFQTVLAQVEPQMAKLEALRAATSKATRTAWFVGVGFALAGLAFLPAVGNPIPVMIGVVLGAVVGSLIAHGPRSSYRAAYKNSLVSAVLKAMHPGLSYAPGSGVTESMFDNSRLFPRSPDRYDCEDKLAGRIGNVGILVSEVHAERKHVSRDSKGKRRTSYSDIFKGVFFTAEFPRKIEGWTLVLPDSESGAMSGLVSLFKGIMPFGSRDEIRMSDPEFEEHFRVQSSDPVEAHYLLTPDFMHRLVRLRVQWGSRIRLAFHSNLLFLAIPSTRDFLEPGSIGGGEMSAHTEVSRIYQELSMLLDIVEDCDLQNDLWK